MERLKFSELRRMAAKKNLILEKEIPNANNCGCRYSVAEQSGGVEALCRNLVECWDEITSWKIEIVCAQCGKSYESSKDELFCSDECGNKFCEEVQCQEQLS